MFLNHQLRKWKPFRYKVSFSQIFVFIFSLFPQVRKSLVYGNEFETVNGGEERMELRRIVIFFFSIGGALLINITSTY